MYIAAFNHLTPFPGTPLYQRLAEEGRLRFAAWWLDPAYQYNEVPFVPKTLSPQDITGGCVAARKRFYRWSGILRRSLRNAADAFMFRNYFPINALHRREIGLRHGYPLGDQAWRGSLLEVG